MDYEQPSDNLGTSTQPFAKIHGGMTCLTTNLKFMLENAIEGRYTNEKGKTKLILSLKESTQTFDRWPVHHL